MPYAPAVQALASRTGSSSRWDWERTLDFTQKTFDDLSPRYGAALRDYIAADYFTHHDAPYGQSRGCMHPDPLVEVFATGTLDDPVCTVHESGHLLAYRNVARRESAHAVFNVAEIQSMFAQEHAYERLRQQEDPAAVAVHRLHYYLGTLQTIPFYLGALQKQEASEPLAQTFKTWAMNPALAAVALVAERAPAALHQHPFAALVTPVLYRLYQGAHPAQKKEMLAGLYEQGADVNLPGLLAAFGVRTPGDMQAVAMLAVTQIAQEVRQIAPQAHAAPSYYRP